MKYLAIIIPLLLIVGCSSVAPPVKTPPVATPPVSTPPVATPPVSPPPDSGSAGQIVEITMTAKQFEFSPSTITVNKGDTVKITLTTLDVAHGFGIPEFNVNERVEPGTPIIIQFVADKSGTFEYRCTVPCGGGHMQMTGQLIVR
jgi:cytochrome c oxidase subunit II